MAKILLEYQKRRVLNTLFRILIFLSVFGYVGAPQTFLRNSIQTEFVLSNERKVSTRNFSYSRASNLELKKCISNYIREKEAIALLAYNKLSKVDFDNISKKLFCSIQTERFFRKEILLPNF